MSQCQHCQCRTCLYSWTPPPQLGGYWLSGNFVQHSGNHPNTKLGTSASVPVITATAIKMHAETNTGGNLHHYNLNPYIWDPIFRLENTKSPRPENPGIVLKHHNLAHPEPVLKLPPRITKKCNFLVILLKTYFFSNFRQFPGQAQVYFLSHFPYVL